jgi:DNA-binding response OmpR family regulator
MKPRVLLVDDDAPMRSFVRKNLEARDHEVLEAANGMEALALLRHEQVELVILDIMMPHLDGYETCRRLREFTDVPVIVLTAMGDERDIVAALDCGADDYLTKPFGVEELLARIRSVLRRVSRDTETETKAALTYMRPRATTSGSTSAGSEPRSNRTAKSRTSPPSTVSVTAWDRRLPTPATAF